MFWGPLPSCFKSHQPAVIPREQLCEIPSPQIADAPGLPINNDDPQSTKDIGCSRTASYSWRATRLQAVLSLQPLGVISGNLFSILDAFYHQTFASVKIQAMEILRTPKSRFELINLAVETREFFGYLNHTTEFAILCVECVRGNLASLETLRCLPSYA